MTITLYAYVSDYLRFESWQTSSFLAFLEPSGITAAQFTIDLEKYSVSETERLSQFIVTRRNP